MGAYCPAPVVSDVIHKRILERIVEPMHQHLSGQPIPYRGVLFIGLMIDEHGDPYVVEFNVRFGDPECQVTLPLVETDMYELLHAAATDSLHNVPLQLSEGSALTVVLASEGYPQAPIKGRAILGLGPMLQSSSYRHRWINMAGVKSSSDGTFIASGGRVLSATAMGSDLVETQRAAYELLSKIQLEGGHFRTDIGHRAVG
jgi:phosphoribosylamine--glycine ligase